MRIKVMENQLTAETIIRITSSLGVSITLKVGEAQELRDFLLQNGAVTIPAQAAMAKRTKK